MKNSELEHLEVSEFDPSSSHMYEEETKKFTPRNMDYREELKSKGIKLVEEDYQAGETKKACPFNPEKLL